MAINETLEMNSEEALRSQVFMARNRIGDLVEQLSVSEGQLRDMRQRLSLTEQEKAILDGRDDGCIRVNELRPLLRRVFEDAA